MLVIRVAILRRKLFYRDIKSFRAHTEKFKGVQLHDSHGYIVGYNISKLEFISSSKSIVNKFYHIGTHTHRSTQEFLYSLQKSKILFNDFLFIFFFQISSIER